MAVSQSLTVTQESQNTANNTSTIRIKWTSTQSWASYNDISHNDAYYSYSINGGTANKKTVTYTLPKGTTATIVNATVTVPHDNNGKCSVVVKTWMDTRISAGVVELSKTLALTDIARKSTLSVADGTLNTAQTLTVTRKNSSFTHTIVAKCGDASKTICTKSSSTSILFTPPLAWASQNTTGTSVSVTYTITTYNGSTSVGSNSYTNTCAIPSSVKPSCSIEVTDAMGYADTYGAFIKGKSKFKVVVTATKAYDSAIASYSTTANGSTYTASSFTTGVIKTSGTLDINATVKDKRGRSGTATVSNDVLDYSAPKITTLSVGRCDSDGTANDQGDYAKLSFNAVVSGLDNHNTAAYVVKYKKTSDSDYTSVALSSYAGNYSPTNASYVFAADSEVSYDIELSVTDAFTTVSKNTSVSTAFTIFDILKTGLGWAFGKVAELTGYLEIALKTHFYDAVSLSNNVGIYGTKPDGTEVDAFKASNESGNTVVGYGNYDQKSGNTNIYGHDVYLGVSNTDNPGYYRPYFRKGETLTFNVIYTSGFVTNSGKDVYFYVSFPRPIVGSPTVTAESIEGLTLRQNNSYTHGSTASVAVSPNSYTVTLNAYYGAVIKATFSNTTNVTNNDAIGIRWSGKIVLS